MCARAEAIGNRASISAMTVADLPAMNAVMNGLSTIFISSGWWLIRRGHWRQHIVCMISALAASTIFLAGYLIYHAQVGEKSSGYHGVIAWIYFPMLITHVLLAFVALPLVIVTLLPALRRRWDRHRSLGRWTMPIWLYVSATGVLVYLFLYQWFPPAHLASPR
jgi:uncharacterized membrane protein YozB (DUF420 family)